MKNTIGNDVAVTLFGESHGPYIGAVLDGMAPGIYIKEEYIAHMLTLRRPSGRISTSRREKDAFEIVSGVVNGRTTGTPIAIVIPNTNVQSGDYAAMETVARPSHADYPADCKYHVCPRKASRDRPRRAPPCTRPCHTPNRARRGKTPRHRGAHPLRAPKDATPLGERTDRTRAPPSRLPSASRAKNPCASDMPPCASSKPPTKSIKTAGAHRRTARRNSQSHQFTRGYARVRISSRTFAQKSSIVEGCVSFVRSRTEMVPSSASFSPTITI